MTAVGLIALGAALCVGLGRRVGGRSLILVLGTAYSLRVAVTLGLYFVSARELPIFRSMQLPGGFWRFTYDAPFYHDTGARIAEALRFGSGVPTGGWGVGPTDFALFVGLVYALLGAHPLYLPLINALLWVAIGILAFALARRLGGERAGMVAAGVVSFWPSTFAWSSQVLKDTCVILLIVLLLELVAEVWQERRWIIAPIAVVVLPAVFLLARLRFYVAALMIPAVLLPIGASAAARFHEPGRRAVIRALALAALLWLPVQVAGPGPEASTPAGLAPGAQPVIRVPGAGIRAILSVERGEPVESVAARERMMAATVERRYLAWRLLRQGEPPEAVSRQTRMRPENVVRWRRALAANGLLPRETPESSPEARPTAHVSPASPGVGSAPAAALAAAAPPAAEPTSSQRPVEPGPPRPPDSYIGAAVALAREGIEAPVGFATRTYSLDRLFEARAGLATAGGVAGFAVGAQAKTARNALGLLPRGLAYALYAPFPWDLFTSGDSGAFRFFAGVETLLMLLLTPFALAALLRAACSRRVEAWILGSFGFLTLVALAVAVTNFGTLFRLRLQPLVPLLTLASAYARPGRGLRSLWDLARSSRRAGRPLHSREAD